MHDEVLVEVPEREREWSARSSIDIMRHAAELDVPLEVNVSWGKPAWARRQGLSAANAQGRDEPHELRRVERALVRADRRALGSAYLRYSFTKGTVQEVDFVVEALGLTSRAIGCSTSAAGPAGTRTSWPAEASSCTASTSASGSSTWPTQGRARRRDVRTARRTLAAVRRGVRRRDLPVPGSVRADDRGRRERCGAARASPERSKPGGTLALSAFSSYFAVKYHEAATFDAATGVSHERTEVRNEHGTAAEVDLWTTCFTPRELRLMCEQVESDVVDIWSVEPGAYQRTPPSTETPEFLVIARRG